MAEASGYSKGPQGALFLTIFFLPSFCLRRSNQQSPHVVISDIQLIFQLVCSYIVAVVASYHSIKSFPSPSPPLRRFTAHPFSRCPLLMFSHTRTLFWSRQEATIVARGRLLSRRMLSTTKGPLEQAFSLYFFPSVLFIFG